MSGRCLSLASIFVLMIPAVGVTSTPNAPTDLIAAKSATTPKTAIDLRWTDRSDNEVVFRIERCIGSGCTDFVFIDQVGANATTFENFDLPGGMTYTYRVQALNDSGASAFSNVAEASTDPLEPPDAPPTSLTATSASPNQASLTWQDNSTNESGFDVERCSGAQCTQFLTVGLVGPNVTSHVDSALNSNTTYSYRVRATNNDGASGYSNVAVTTTADGPPLATPALVARAVRQGGRVSVELSWDDKSNDETSFEIERCAGASCSNFALLTVTAPNTTTFIDRSVTRRSTYRYRVRAAKGSSKSGYSNVASATTQ
jgi:fibronectin type III domain protein